MEDKEALKEEVKEVNEKYHKIELAYEQEFKETKEDIYLLR